MSEVGIKAGPGLSRVIKITRIAAVWKCKSCGRDYGVYPEKCDCAVFPSQLTLVEGPVSEVGARRTYRVEKNFMYRETQYTVGQALSLQEKDMLTEDLVKRGIIRDISRSVGKVESKDLLVEPEK